MLVTEDERGLKIALGKQDLDRFGLDYGSIDYDNKKTRDMLNSLLSGAEQMVGFSLDKQKLTIEVFPDEKDGCIIYFALSGDIDPRRLRIKNTSGRPRVFEFDSSETMLCALSKLSKCSKFLKKSELYEFGGKYRLVIWERGNTSAQILREFGEEIKCPFFATAFIGEHGNLLSSPDAVGTVSAAFGNDNTE